MRRLVFCGDEELLRLEELEKELTLKLQQLLHQQVWFKKRGASLSDSGSLNVFVTKHTI